MSDVDLSKIVSVAGVEAPPARRPRQKNRKGLKGLLTHHDPAVIRQLHIIGAERDLNQHQLVREALNMLFARYGKSQIA